MMHLIFARIKMLTVLKSTWCVRSETDSQATGQWNVVTGTDFAVSGYCGVVLKPPRHTIIAAINLDICLLGG